MTSDNASPGASTVAELDADRPSPVHTWLGGDAVAPATSGRLWVSINGSPAGDWDASAGRVSSGLSLAISTLVRERRHGARNVDLGSER